MKVYVVYEYDGDDMQGIGGVFSSLEGAKRFVQKMGNSYHIAGEFGKGSYNADGDWKVEEIPIAYEIDKEER